MGDIPAAYESDEKRREMLEVEKKDLEEYLMLEQRIQTKKNRIEKLKKMAVQREYGAVRGSNPEFPYQPMSFHMSGYNIGEDERKRFRIRSLSDAMKKDIAVSEQKRLDVEKFIESIPDVMDQLIFTYIYLEGNTQEQAARKLHMDRSSVSKRIKKYFPEM